MATIIDEWDFKADSLNISDDTLKLMNTFLKENIRIGRGKKARCVLIDDLIPKQGSIDQIARSLAFLINIARSLRAYVRNESFIKMDEVMMDIMAFKKAYKVIRNSITSYPALFWEIHHNTLGFIITDGKDNNIPSDFNEYKTNTLKCLDTHMKYVESLSKYVSNYKHILSSHGPESQFFLGCAFHWIQYFFDYIEINISKSEIYRLMGSVIYDIDPRKGSQDAVKKAVLRALKQTEGLMIYREKLEAETSSLVKRLGLEKSQIASQLKIDDILLEHMLK